MPLDKVLLYLDGLSEVEAARRTTDFADLVAAIGAAISGKGYKEYIEAIGGKDG